MQDRAKAGKSSNLISGTTGDWEVVIGMEVHAQVNSRAKLFSGASTEFGGERWWFTCPLKVNDVNCNRRVGKLYLPPGANYFGCRSCHELTSALPELPVYVSGLNVTDAVTGRLTGCRVVVALLLLSFESW